MKPILLSLVAGLFLVCPSSMAETRTAQTAGKQPASAASASAAETAAPDIDALRRSPFLVVLLYDEACKDACMKVKAVMPRLTERYKGKVAYVELNKDHGKLKETKRIAKALGPAIFDFLRDEVDEVPAVGIFGPDRKPPEHALEGRKSEAVYVSEINAALAQYK